MENKALHLKYDKINSERKYAKQELVYLRSDFEESNQYSRNRNVIIEGVPVMPNEDTSKLAMQAMKKVGVSIATVNVEACHRLLASRARPKELPIVIKWFDRKAAEACIIHSRKERKFRSESTLTSAHWSEPTHTSD